MCTTTGGVKGGRFTGFICTVLRRLTLVMELMAGHFIKFRRNVNSATRLEILRPMENCGPY